MVLYNHGAVTPEQVTLMKAYASDVDTLKTILLKLEGLSCNPFKALSVECTLHAALENIWSAAAARNVPEASIIESRKAFRKYVGYYRGEPWWLALPLFDISWVYHVWNPSMLANVPDGVMVWPDYLKAAMRNALWQLGVPVRSVRAITSGPVMHSLFSTYSVAGPTDDYADVKFKGNPLELFRDAGVPALNDHAEFCERGVQLIMGIVSSASSESTLGSVANAIGNLHDDTHEAHVFAKALQSQGERFLQADLDTDRPARLEAQPERLRDTLIRIFLSGRAALENMLKEKVLVWIWFKDGSKAERKEQYQLVKKDASNGTWSIKWMKPSESGSEVRVATNRNWVFDPQSDPWLFEEELQLEHYARWERKRTAALAPTEDQDSEDEDKVAGFNTLFRGPADEGLDGAAAEAEPEPPEGRNKRLRPPGEELQFARVTRSRKAHRTSEDQ